MASSSPQSDRRSSLAQGPSQSGTALLRRGNQVVINGRPQAVPWVQWGKVAQADQVNTAIADFGLAQFLGLELLNTRDFRQQPVKWFSPPLPLAVQWSPPYRFLDATALLRQTGWDIQAEGETLRLTLVPPGLTNVSWGLQPSGDRVVLDLERPAPWQLDWQGGEAVITLAATASPELLQRLAPSLEGIARDALQHSPAPQVESGNGQTIVRVKVPTGLYPTLTTLANPPRLVIDTRPLPLPPRDIAWAPGLRWQQKTLRVGEMDYPVIWLALNLRQPGLTVKPFWTDTETLVGTGPLLTTAQRQQAIAAINGGFFNRNTQLPLGVIRRDGRWVSGPILNRGAIGWTQTGAIWIGRFSLQETLTTADGKQFPVLTLNSGYVQAGISRYTLEWGTTYTPIVNDEILIGIQNQQVIGYAQGGPAGQTAFPIPPDGYLLTLRSNKSAVDAFPIGSLVKLESRPEPEDVLRFPQILGAGPLLIQNRQIVLDPKLEKFSDAFSRESAVRSAIGRTVSGELLLVAVQSQPYQAGPTLTEMARMMEQLGAVDALNLDGGSSTSLYLGGWLLNRSPQSVARVHNGIGVFWQPPPK
ncbi:phosphodiester glycosidase family protein [Leptolyngbya sp. 'hensonii']|uniref:phosphodiester glycosidase family protein n=1 Tax=Leptolyngbya sp. 'hensonii' TaxID=1922337 RepID=UPI00094F50C5|nr:phosphodiester glycosidase family protein [Leptolyngbya sp. 'hensonii']